MFERILVPLDGSRSSGRAVSYAIETAKRFAGEIILFQVVRPTSIVAPSSPVGSSMVSPATTQVMIDSAREQERQSIARAKRYLQGQLRKVTTSGLKGSLRVEVGDPAESMIELCRKEAIGLVVMTTSGKSGLKRAFLGSVADRVVREPGFPVLAIRPQVRRKH